MVLNDSLEVIDVDQTKIAEHVKHSWYEGEEALHPSQGVTDPSYTGFTASGNIDGDGKLTVEETIELFDLGVDFILTDRLSEMLEAAETIGVKRSLE